jgi:hypothetical protein
LATISLLPDEIDVFRIVWFPDNYDGESIVAAQAFPSKELTETYSSVDRSDLFDINFAMQIARQQKSKANGNDVKREKAYGIVIHCGSIRKIKLEVGQSTLDVIDKSHGFHQSHCGVCVTGPKPSRADINELRRQMIEIIQHEKTFVIAT